MGIPDGSAGKESTCNAGTHRCGHNPWVQKIARKRKWQPIPVCLPEKSHGQRSPAGYRPKGHKEWDMTNHASLIWPCLLVGNIDSLTMLVLGTSLIVAEGSHLPKCG